MTHNQQGWALASINLIIGVILFGDLPLVVTIMQLTLSGFVFGVLIGEKWS